MMDSEDKVWRVSGLRNDASFTSFRQEFATRAEADNYYESQRKLAKYIELVDMRDNYLT